MACPEINAAVDFLCEPLTRLGLDINVRAVKNVLEFTILDYHTERPIKLIFGNGMAPPCAITSACMACNISWVEWARILPASFELIINDTVVTIEHNLPGVASSPVILWLPHPPGLTSAKFDDDLCPQYGAQVSSFTSKRMIQPSQRSTIIPCQTPPVSVEGDESPVESPHSSAPSSTYSSGSSYPDSQYFQSLRSVSPIYVSIPASSTSSGNAAALNPRVQVPYDCAGLGVNEASKYLYQGGVSTVLTGGVMLGASAPPFPQTMPAQGFSKFQRMYTAPPRFMGKVPPRFQPPSQFVPQVPPRFRIA